MIRRLIIPKRSLGSSALLISRAFEQELLASARLQLTCLLACLKWYSDRCSHVLGGDKPGSDQTAPEVPHSRLLHVYDYVLIDGAVLVAIKAAVLAGRRSTLLRQAGHGT